MSTFLRFVKRVRCSVVLLTSTVMALPISAEAFEPYPAEEWAAREQIETVLLSPDGKYLSLLVTDPGEGDTVIGVYETTNLKEPVHIQRAKPMNLQYYFWVSDTEILFGADQRVRRQVRGFNRGVFSAKTARVNIVEKTMKEFTEQGFRFEHVLPNKPGKVMLSLVEGSQGGGAQRASAYRTPSYYEMDLKSGRKKLLFRSKISLGNFQLDIDGNAYAAGGRDGEYGTVHYRAKEDGPWKEIYRQHRDSFEDFAVVGREPGKDDHLLVIAHNGSNTRGLWSFDAVNAKFAEPVYQRADVDVWGIRTHSNRWTNMGELVGVVVRKDHTEILYWHNGEAEIYKTLAEQIPNARYLFITSRSRDGKTIVVGNSGPRDPGSYYLYKDGVLSFVGSSMPHLDSERLADVEFISYKARDGRTIHGYLTVPNGKPPFPLVIMPHGGPFVAEFVNYDPWSQMLANHGYMVLQPQYRGSHNYGLEHYRIAFEKGSEAGGKMQDDKDDGALHLIEQGRVDPDRLAMVGWSYGGYAALVASSRDPQIYQCVVAGAAVSDPIMQVNYYRDRVVGAQRLEQVGTWTGAYSPIDNAESVNVPMLLIHGTVESACASGSSEQVQEGT